MAAKEIISGAECEVTGRDFKLQGGSLSAWYPGV